MGLGEVLYQQQKHIMRIPELTLERHGFHRFFRDKGITSEATVLQLLYYGRLQELLFVGIECLE